MLTPHTYLDALDRAGAQVVVLAPMERADAARLVRLVDGVVLAGGTDVEPSLYGEPADKRLEETRRDRDLFELQVARAALGQDVPVLGICRGLQILNVATGGTLHQHLLDHTDSPSTGRSRGAWTPPPTTPSRSTAIACSAAAA